MHRRSNLHRRLIAEQSGTVIILFALLIVPIAGLMAGALDFARQMSVKQQLQESLDSAALAVAKEIHANWNGDPEQLASVQEQAQAIGAQMFLANFTPNAGISAPQPRFTFLDDRVGASADVVFPASLLGILGIEQLAAAGYVEVVVPSRMRAEIVLVLDYSGSMKDNDKYKRMTEAAVGFIKKVQQSASFKSVFGLVPFSDFVVTSMKGRYIKDVKPALWDQQFDLCVSNRDYPYSTTDETPGAGTSASKWKGIGLPEGSLTIAGQLSSGFGDVLYGNRQIDNLVQYCQSMVDRKLHLYDLTDEFQNLSASLFEMQPDGYTNIALGAEIGWHILTANEPYTSGAHYSDKNTKKILILLTDGMQTVPADGPSGPTLDGANESLSEVCNNMDATGVQVFTIAYDLNDDFTRDLLSECASGPSQHFEAAANSDLSKVFEQIYDELAQSVWLAK